MANESVVYPKAPITEAVCDIRIAPPEGLGLGHLTEVADRLRAQYPQTEEQEEIRVLSAQPAAPKLERHKLGILGRSDTNDRAYQAQLTGVSVSRLRPYTEWHDLQSEAHRVWETYRDVVRPAGIRRLALRYINRIDIPGLGPIRLEDYFQTYIELSKNLGAAVSNFFFQIHLPQTDIEAMCVVNSGGLPPALSSGVSILLDIDVFRIDNVPQEEKALWDFFDVLRLRKNLVFEALITDKARELFR
jgi:uncharacterized protein (TIGR04255 family)